MTNKDLIEDGDLTADGYDDALEGILLSVDEEGKLYRRVVYSTDKVIQNLMDQGMPEFEACEFFEFNILGAYVGKHTPVFVPRVWS